MVVTCGSRPETLTHLARPRDKRHAKEAAVERVEDLPAAHAQPAADGVAGREARSKGGGSGARAVKESAVIRMVAEAVAEGGTRTRGAVRESAHARVWVGGENGRRGRWVAGRIVLSARWRAYE